MSAKLLTTGSAKVRKIKPAKAKAGSSVAGGGRNETGHLQNSNSFHERYAAARGLSRAAREKNASRRKIAEDGILSYCFYLFKKSVSAWGQRRMAAAASSRKWGCQARLSSEMTSCCSFCFRHWRRVAMNSSKALKPRSVSAGTYSMGNLEGFF